MENQKHRIVIKHLTGSKANQVEEFDYDNQTEISLGRSSNSDVKYDPNQDDVVSREHGKITKDAAYTFSITDNNSRNGIFVNKQRIQGKVQLNLGDQVQLGNNGPIFVFDLDPRPKEMMSATRMVEIPTSVKPTAEFKSPEDKPTSMPVEPPKTGIGKQTVERMIGDTRRKTQQTMLFGIVGAAVVLGALAYVFWPKPTKIIQGTSTTTVIVKPEGKTPTEIAKDNRKKVVQIEFGWQLYLTQTNDLLYHEFTAIKDDNGQTRYVALYVQTPEGKIEPKLTTNKNVPSIPVGITGATGSGFVVSPDGFILTNRHVATNWRTRYSFPDFCFPGFLVGSDNRINTQSVVQAGNVFGWVPEETRQFGGNVGNKSVIGKNTYLRVVFADSDQRIPASGEPRPSDEHDVALIKVDVPGNNLAFVEINDKGPVNVGDPVVVMGYPGVTPATYSFTTSKDIFNQVPQYQSMAVPTITPGNIGTIHTKSAVSGDSKIVASTFGDAYQLTLNATGGGNSGGPLLDRDGKVIGIYFASQNEPNGPRITFAVPIKYGSKLLNIGM